MANNVSSDGVKDLKKRLSALSKQYKSLSEAEFTRSGSVVLDAILGGGIPRGVFILWSAENGCGKSTGCLHVSRVYCMQKKRVLYLDYEGGVNDSQIDGMGLREYLYNEDTNPEGLFILYQVQTYKDGEAILDEIMADVDLVIVDSATAMLTEKVKGASSEDALPGVDSRVMSTFLKKYKAEAVREGVTWIIINQMRTKISFMGSTGDVEAGGNALKYYPDIRLMMKKAWKGTLEREEDTATGKQKVPFGAICQVWAEKNRYERPKIPLNMAIIFGRGISNEYAYYDYLERYGVVKKSGAWFTIKMAGLEDKVQGMNRVIDWINDHKDAVRDFINAHGGYKLLLNEEKTVNIGSNPNDSSGDAYSEATIASGTEFDIAFEGSEELTDGTESDESGEGES